ncbi:MAG: InlB B-repeat-containing protein [Clostridia bacterium]|nr:InlB B-repeat-containing protein [Clostridia bacterium]
MKNKLKALLSCLIVACTLGAFSACGGSSKDDDNSVPESVTSEAPGTSEEPGTSDGGETSEGGEVVEKTYVVSFEGAEVASQEVVEGEKAEKPADPADYEEDGYAYTFDNWYEEGSDTAYDFEAAVTGNITLVAQFTKTAIEYTAKVVVNGEETTVSYTVENAAEKKAEIEEMKPANTAEYSYAWAEELPESLPLENNKVYTVNKTPIVYTATVVVDGEETTVSYTVENAAEKKAEIEAMKPTDTAEYSYAWAEELPESLPLENNKVYTVNKTPIEYTITFVDENGDVLSETTYKYGAEVVAPSDPSKAETEVYTFVFAGWDSNVEVATGTKTYTATYTATLKSGLKANEVSAKGEGVVLANGSIGGGANYTKGQQNDDGDETPSFVSQSYLAFDGNYGCDSYVAFDFTGKNMPEVAFFAKNYNDSMYAEGTSKQGIVVYTGITTYDGQDAFITEGKDNGTYINFSYPYMIQDASNGGFVMSAFKDSALGRANLVDGTHYRVIMGFTKGSDHGANGITLHWYLYNLDTNEVVENSTLGSWNFFTGSNADVGNMTLDDLVGSIVLYGKFGVECTLDKVYGVYENTSISAVADGLNNGATYTVSFQDENGEELDSGSFEFGATPVFNGTIPTPTKQSVLYNYSYAWDKSIGRVTGDTVYKLTLVKTEKDGVTASNVTEEGNVLTLGAGSIGDGANYTKGQNNGGYVSQAYLGLDGNYGLNNYIVFDFTGKNMPEIAFFAKNYNASMYAEGTSKEGIVVVTGITTWDGQLGSDVNGNGTQINYGFPYMIQDAANGGFVSGSFAESKLGRANLVDNTHYRVIMGFTGGSSKGEGGITLHWCLYNLDTNEVVEQSSMETWNFFTGSNAQVGNKTLNDLSGSIVLYGKFGTTCTIDKLHGVESGDFATVVENAKKK